MCLSHLSLSAAAASGGGYNARLAWVPEELREQLADYADHLPVVRKAVRYTHGRRAARFQESLNKSCFFVNQRIEAVRGSAWNTRAAHACEHSRGADQQNRSEISIEKAASCGAEEGKIGTTLHQIAVGWFQRKPSKCLIVNGLFGGPGRDRTDDLFHAMEARSQTAPQAHTWRMQLFYCLRLEGIRQTLTLGRRRPQPRRSFLPDAGLAKQFV